MPGYEFIGAEEEDSVLEVFRSGGVLFRHGFDAIRQGSYKVREFEELFAARFGQESALAVSSGTAALRVALASLGIGPGDEVVTQSFTFVATIEAIVESGATPVCAEIDDTLNISVADLQERITPRTKAVIAVHMLGNPAPVSELVRFCKKNDIYLIEDTAWGCGGAVNGKLLGTWGDVGAFSFDHAKVITTGEGGMVIHRSPQHHAKARAWHDHGHENNPDLPRWEDSRSSSGFNFRMSELQGAVGIAQLRKLDQIVTAQRGSAQRIRDVFRSSGIENFRRVVDGGEPTDDAVVVFLESAERAAFLRRCLADFDLATKILPEAISWHFAGSWNHIRELETSHGKVSFESWPQSSDILSRALAVSVPSKMGQDHLSRLGNSLRLFRERVI